MLRGQKLYTSDNRQVLLFPLEYLYMTQDEGGDFSHAGTLSIDFAGWGKNGVIRHCPYYAPCDCKCIYQSVKAAYNIWQSLNKVLFADGSYDYVTLMAIHDENLPKLGTVCKQGDVLGHTGAAGHATGDHLHLNIAKGKYVGQEQVPPNNKWQLKNSRHIYNCCFVNDTVIVRGYNHRWIKFDGGNPDPGVAPKRKKFNWVLYSRNLRNKRLI